MSGLEEGISNVPHLRDKSVVLLFTTLHVPMVSQAGKEPRNLAGCLAMHICCFSLPSVPSWKNLLPHITWFVKLSIRVRYLLEGWYHDPNTANHRTSHSSVCFVQGGWRAQDTNRTNQHPSLAWMYGPWENKGSLLAKVPKLGGCSLGTCNSHRLSHMEKLKPQNKLRV